MGYDYKEITPVDEVKRIQNASRIIYVEPNDVYGFVGETGVPITPEYSDLCISFDLICEQTSRVNSSNGTVGKNDKNYAIMSWISLEKNQDGTLQSSQFSFMTGSEGNEYYKLLTTYYTDISLNEIRKANQVEGLGISSVNITFESFYTPTIKIKFVDVRGSALFAREEEIHTNVENEYKAVSDNIFGCFFTMPYPKFRMQVKGFYGQAVTYQLTCTDFRGSYNANTGNFETDVTFVGYDYGLLCDIPMQYLMAAPECSYLGKDYWEQHCTSDKTWELSNGERPIKLNKLYRNIASAMTVNKEDNEKVENNNNQTEGSAKGNANSSQITNFTEKKKRLNEYIISFNKTVESLKAKYNVWVEDEDFNKYLKGKLYIFNVKGTNGSLSENEINNLSFSDGMVNCKNSLCKIIYNLNVDYETKLPYINKKTYNNSDDDILQTNGKFSVSNFSKIDNKWIPDDTINLIFSGDSYNFEDFIQGGALSECERVSDNIIYSMNNALENIEAKTKKNDPNSDINNMTLIFFTDFGYVNKIGEEIAELNTKINEIKSYSSLNGEKVVSIKTLTGGITPFIGNIFKIVMCHLETFIYIVDRCSELIEKQMEDKTRGRKMLGVNSLEEGTDITIVGLSEESNSDNLQIPPWPGIVTQGITPEDGQDGDDDTCLRVQTWPGDLGRQGGVEWEEVKLVKGLLYSIKNNNQSTKVNISENNSVMSFPIAPFDINYENIDNIATLGVDSLVGYLGIRAAGLFGLCYTNATTETAKILGKLEAFSLYKNFYDNEAIHKLFNDTKGTSFEEIANGIVKCNHQYDSYGELRNEGDTIQRHKFELCDNPIGIKTRKRQPIFEEEGNNLKYVYTRTKKSKAIVPVHLSSYESLQTDTIYAPFKYEGTKDENLNYPNGSYYKPIYDLEEGEFCVKERNFITSQTPSSLYSDNDLSHKGGKINNTMFNICEYDGSNAKVKTEKVMKIYNDFKNGELKAYTYKETIEGLKENYLDKYWHISSNDYSKYFDNCDQYFSVNLSEYNLKNKQVLPSDRPNDGKLSTDFEFNNKDWYDKSGNYEIKYDKTNGGWKTNKKTLTENEYTVQDNLIRNVTKTDNASIPFSLWLHPIYSWQNDTSECTNGLLSIPEFGKYSSVEIVNYKKAFLYLMTLPYNYTMEVFSDINNDGEITCAPLGYLLFIGGCLWRKTVNESINKDILHLTGFKSMYEKIPLVKIDGVYKCCFIPDDNNTFDYLSESEFLKNVLDKEYVKNELIRLFEIFVKTTWGSIRDACEFKLINGDIPYIQDFYNLNQELTNATRENLLSDECLGMFSNFLRRVRMIGWSKDTGSGKRIAFDEKLEIQETMKYVYSQKVIIIRSRNMSMNTGTCIISKSNFNAYVNGFWDTLTKIKNNNNSLTENGDAIDMSTMYDSKDRDFCINIYNYIKNLWDRWLLTQKGMYTEVYLNGNSEPQKVKWYTVAGYFSNFTFIDMYYRNVYKKLHINCDLLYKAFEGIDEYSNLLKFLDFIATQHSCLFIGLPDYIDLGMDSQNSVNNLKDIFRAVPYSKKRTIQSSNRFIIMYRYPPSKIADDKNGYASDTFDIFKESDKIMKIFDKNSHSDIEESIRNDYMSSQINRYGYAVPAFGVALNRQNNHLFKNFTASMSNPVVTEQSINAMAAIADRASGNPKGIVFYGQDLYPTYTGYSYTVEIDMMGDAQIMPLMYLHLFNMPMFRGTYLIYSVSHEIQPGNMNTHIKAMKMARNASPYCTAWFTSAIDWIWTDKDGNVHFGTKCDGDPVENINGTYYVYTGENGVDYSQFIESDKPWYVLAKNETGVEEDNNNKNCGKAFEKYQKGMNQKLNNCQAWCGYFVAWCLKQKGYDFPKDYPTANSWKNYGNEVKVGDNGEIPEGAIVVVSDGNTNSGSHVAFAASNNIKNLLLLGGNQGGSRGIGRVCTINWPSSNVISIRWPIKNKT